MKKQTMERDWIGTARTLSEALPYLQRFTGSVVVVKFGGNAIRSPCQGVSPVSKMNVGSLAGAWARTGKADKKSKAGMSQRRWKWGFGIAFLYR